MRQDRAAKLFQTTIRRVASDNSLEAPLGDWRPRADGRLVWGTFKVPRRSALAWLRLSGKGGLFIRQFLSPSTGVDCAVDRFAVRWIRSSPFDAEKADDVWQTLKEIDGFCGLVLGKKDVGVRLGKDHPEAAVAVEQAISGKHCQIKNVRKDCRWWALRGVEDVDAFKIDEIIVSFGLQKVGPIRSARDGSSRRKFFFLASGAPTRKTLDDGSWGAAPYTLSEADPPPAKKPQSPGLSSPPECHLGQGSKSEGTFPREEACPCASWKCPLP